MSADQHRADAHDTPVDVRVVTVSSTRTLADDRSGDLVAELVAAAGHTIAGRSVVDDDVPSVARVVEEAAGADLAVLVLTGGTGMTGRDVTPEAVEPLFSRRLDGFGELFRSLSYAEIGAAAMLSRACAGLVGRTLVFALPGSTAACRLAVEKLILPDLAHLVRLVRTDRTPARPPPPADEDPTVDAEFEPETVPPPTGALGRPGRAVTSVAIAAAPDEPLPPAAGPDAGGWLRAVHDVRGTVVRDEREALPAAIEKLAPVTNVLEQAGETAVLALEDGRRYALFGFPDLRRPSSKVLAVRDASPLAEVLALHRHPTTTGTCVDGGGLCPPRSRDAAEVAEAVAGRPPPGPVGPLFAITGGAVLYERDGRIHRWDGAREREEGTPKQALATLVLEWSQR